MRALIYAQARKKLSLDSSSYVVAYFLNGQCPCSQSHFDHLNELQKKI